MSPLHDVEPLIVAVTNGRTKRLLGNDLRQHDMIVGVGQAQPLACETRSVRRIGIAAARVVSFQRFVSGRKRDGLELHLVGAEVVREVELRRRALLYTHGGVIELQRRIHLQRLANQKALAVEVVDAGEIQTERRITRRGPGGISSEHVDIAGLQRREAVPRGQRHKLDLVRVIEDCSGKGTTEIDIEAGPAPLRIWRTETCKRTVRAAIQNAALLDRGKRLSRSRRGGGGQYRCQRDADESALHSKISHNATTGDQHQPPIAVDQFSPRLCHQRTLEKPGQGVAVAQNHPVNAWTGRETHT